MIMSCCAIRWQDGNPGETGAMRRPWTRQPWTAWEIALMVIGFVVFWPVGLAILFWILWNKRRGAAMAMPAWVDRFTGSFAPSGGNSAFAEWKRAELDRLEQERRKLAEAEKEFAAFLDQLKRAKDREEFERFMAARGQAGAAPA
jgi:Protein of unknown function (DUF2852)